MDQKQKQDLEQEVLRQKAERKKSVVMKLRREELFGKLHMAMSSMQNPDALLVSRQDCGDYHLQTYAGDNLLKHFFQQQLSQLQKGIDQLYNKKASLPQFILLCLEILKCPEEHAAFMVNGLRQLFEKVSSSQELSGRLLSYEQFVRYNINSHPMPPIEQPETKLLLRLEQAKHQSRIFHEHAIAQCYYFAAKKWLFVLDQQQTHIKVVNPLMKMLVRMSPRKQKVCIIRAFAISEIQDLIMLTLDIGNVVFIKIEKYVQDSSYSDSQIIYSTISFAKCVYLEMPNLWLATTDDGTLYRVDPQKIDKSTRIQLYSLPTITQRIQIFLELPQRGWIIVAHDNKVTVFNERLNHVYQQIMHVSRVRSIRIGDVTGDLYVSGNQNYVTRFGKDFTVNQIIQSSGKADIASVLVFQAMEMLVMVDRNADLRLIDRSQNHEGQVISLKHMKKDKGQFVLTKTSKHEFVVTKQSVANYSIVKKAIEVDYTINLLPGIFMDGNMLRICMNDQLMDINLLTGLAMQTYSWDNSNNDKRLRAFCYSFKQRRFILLDDDNSIKEMFLKQQKEETSERYGKKTLMKDCTGLLLDNQRGILFAYGRNALYGFKYTGLNSFNILRSAVFPEPFELRNLNLNSQTCVITGTHSRGTIQLNSNLFTASLTKYPFRPEHFLPLTPSPKSLVVSDQSKLYIQEANHLTAVKQENRIFRVKLITIRGKVSRTVSAAFSDDQEDKAVNVYRILVLLCQFGCFILYRPDKILASASRPVLEQFNAFTSFSKILDPAELPTKTLLLNKETINLQKLLGPGVFIKGHPQQVFDLQGFFCQQPIIASIGHEGGIKLWGLNGSLIMHFVLPTFAKLVNQVPSILVLKNARSLKRTKIVLQQIIALKKRTKITIKQINDRVKGDSAVGAQDDFLFTVNSLQYKYSFDQSPTVAQNKSQALQSSPRQSDFQKRFGNHCKIVNKKHPGKSVPREIEDQRKRLHFEEAVDTEVSTKRTLFRIKRLGGYRKSVAQQFSSRVGLDLSAQQKLELNDIQTPQPKQPYSPPLAQLKQKCQIDRLNKKSVPSKKVNQLDEIDREFMLRNRKHSYASRTQRVNKKSESLNNSDYGQIQRKDVEMDAAKLLLKVKKLFQEERKKHEKEVFEKKRRQVEQLANAK